VISFLFWTFLVGQASPEADSESIEALRYGEVFFLETQEMSLPRFSLSVGYAKDLNNSFLDLHGFAGSAQIRLWKYLSTGIFGQWIHSDLTGTGQELSRLQDQADILFDTMIPRWGVFSLTQLQFMVGKWNVLNILPIQVDLLVGAGAGIVERESRLSAVSELRGSYLWSVEQRVYLFDHVGVHVSFFGHRDAVFIHPGMVVRF